MKTNFRKFISVLSLVALVSTAALTSCSKDEVTSVPEDVTTTIEEAYYIAGVVSDADGLLSGVAVTAGSESTTTDSEGTYSIKMSSSSQTSVNFSKDGYVSIDATATFASDATTGAVAILSQTLTQKAEAKAVTAGEQSELTFEDQGGSDIIVSIPADALTENVEIAVTDYISTATPDAAESLAAAETTGSAQTVTGALTSVDLEPSGITFETPITISIPGEYVEGAYHAKLVGGEWVKQGDVEYDSSTGLYAIQVDGFSQHSIAVDSQVSVSKSSSSSSTVTLATETFDNIGQVSAVSKSVSYSQYSGWELISGNSLSSYVSSIMGSSESVQTIAGSLDVNVAGDQKVTVTITQQVVTTTFDVGTVSAIVENYGNVSVDISIEEGDLRPDHNA